MLRSSFAPTLLSAAATRSRVQEQRYSIGCRSASLGSREKSTWLIDRVYAVLVEDGGELVHEEDVRLQLLNKALGRAGHELHDEAAGGPDRPVRVYEDADADGGGNLLALDHVLRQVLAYLARHELDGADVGLLEADVAADGQHAVPAHEAADVELAVGPRGQVGLGFVT